MQYVYRGTPSEKIIWSCGTYAKKGKAECPKCKSLDEDYIKQRINGLKKQIIKLYSLDSKKEYIYNA